MGDTKGRVDAVCHGYSEMARKGKSICATLWIFYFWQDGVRSLRSCRIELRTGVYNDINFMLISSDCVH
jgi:hypothetical protein